MGIKLLDVEEEECLELGFELTRSFEFMTTMVVLVKVEYRPQDISPYHWFLTRTTEKHNGFSSFDVSFHTYRGNFNYLHFFLLDKDLVFEKPPFVFPELIFKGLPFFDISVYSDKNYHIFEEGDFSYYYYENTIYALNKEQAYSYCVELNPFNIFIFDENDCISGVVLKNISNKEKDVLRECGLI